ncbi:MAG: class I SAM-dependent methyltransferase [Thermodesulfobacteriota bacterium]
MKRIPEPELMDDPEQAYAYGRADFEEPHSNFIELLMGFLTDVAQIDTILDMGCGTGDITFRVAIALPGSRIDAIDGSAAMLHYAEEGLKNSPGLEGRVCFILGNIQEFEPGKSYDLIVSNSLLHHLSDPAHFWLAVKRLSSPGTRVFIMDLMRPASVEEARSLVETYSRNEPDILKRDFYNSLLAAFEVGEVELQLEEAGLGGFDVAQASDRHLIVYGTFE